MKHLLTAIACCLAVAGSAQTSYNPDIDGDGCITVTDVLGVLSQFDTCVEGTKLFYFHDDSQKHPFGGLDIDDFGTSTAYWWLTDESGEFYQSTDFAEFMEWTIENQGWVDEGSNSVMPMDSVSNVALPLAQSIPNGTINMPATEGAGYYFIVVNQELDFPFASTPVFYMLGQTPSAFLVHDFQWRGENWTLLQFNTVTLTLAQTVNVVCGY